MIDKIKLFTFPYAGGNSNVFRPWKKQLNEYIELCPVELAGRGARLFEPLPNSLEEILDDFENLFAQNKSDYTLFGHSMGTIIIFELLARIQKNQWKNPLHVFFSGRNAPHIKKNSEKKYHLMGDEQFRKEVVQLGGTPEEIFNDPELANLFIPVLKNDFRICENYLPGNLSQKYDINFSVIAGTEEDYSEGDLIAYKEFTNKETTVKYFKGGHFFIKESENEVIDYINKTIQRYR